MGYMKDNSENQVSVIIPAFNEEDNISDLVDSLIKLESDYLDYNFQFVFVNDGSTDNTEKTLVEKTKLLHDFKIVNQYFNKGLTYSLKNGVKHAKHKFIFFLPADLQYSPTIIPDFLQKVLEGYDIVTGTKIGNYDKQFVSSIYNWFCRILFKVKVKDINSVKIFNRAIIENMELHRDWHRYIVPLASIQGKRITELPVEIFPRKHGISKFSKRSRILIGLIDLLTLKILWKFQDKPMLVFGSIGLLLLVIGFLSGLYFTFSRLIQRLPYEPSITFVSLFLLSGVLFYLIGFIAEIIIGLKDD